MILWWGLTSTQREARELILGPSSAAKTGLLSFKRMHFRVVTGLLTGNDTLRRHLYIMALIDSPMCRRCGADERTSAHVLCECEALVMIIHTLIWIPFSWTLRMSEVYAWGQSETLLKGQGSHDLDFSLRCTKGLSEAYVRRE